MMHVCAWVCNGGRIAGNGGPWSGGVEGGVGGAGALARAA